MAHKRSGSKPMEWAGQLLVLGSGAGTTRVDADIDLALRDDEVAEIYRIDSNFSGIQAATADGDVAGLLSMDPDSSVSPLATASYTDLEVFYHHVVTVMFTTHTLGSPTTEQNITLNVEQLHNSSEFDSPILVGTNIGASVISDQANLAPEWGVRVYYKRRKATAQELNQILLKRR